MEQPENAVFVRCSRCGSEFASFAGDQEGPIVKLLRHRRDDWRCRAATKQKRPPMAGASVSNKETGSGSLSVASYHAN